MSHPSEGASVAKRVKLGFLLGLPLVFVMSLLTWPGEAGSNATKRAAQATAPTPAAGTPAKPAAAPKAAAPVPQQPFPDFGFLPPPGKYTGPVFVLSQDYPRQAPSKVLPAFFKKLPARPFSSDFNAWRDYMMAVRDYCFEGNTNIDFRVENNKVRKWFHMPWQHYGPSGREGVHGLTKEAQVQPQQLAPTQTYKGGQTYAVGFFNDVAGYIIGKVWANHKDPDPGVTTFPGGFLNGTVIFKLLFVDVPTDQVPSLTNPQKWNGYITDTYNSQNRSFRDVALIQMDIAVRDNRAPTGWLFGTFQYNGALGPANWTNLVPLGIMWGNDPQVTDNTYTNPQPSVTKINPNLKEQAINPSTSEVPPTHLGWNGRLNGPVDNPVSSCMSCHMTAEIPELSPMNPTFQAPDAVPPIGSPVNQPPPAGYTGTWYGGWMRWFQNVRCGVPFDKPGNPWTHEGAKSTDYGLQLAQGITNFYTWRDTESGIYSEAYKSTPDVESVEAIGTKAASAKTKVKPFGAARPSAKIPSAKGKTVFPIIRDMPHDQEQK
jgi:hypothetical protein